METGNATFYEVEQGWLPEVSFETCFFVSIYVASLILMIGQLILLRLIKRCVGRILYSMILFYKFKHPKLADVRPLCEDDAPVENESTNDQEPAYIAIYPAVPREEP